MAGQSLSAWLDKGTTQRLGTIAKLEARPTSQLVAAAVKLYTRLPEEARAALRKVEALGSEEEVGWAMRRVTRALIDAQWEIASQKAAEQAKTDASLDSEMAIEAEAVRLTRER